MGNPAHPPQMFIPYGETRSYGDVARALNTNARAIGQTRGAYPLPILIPVPPRAANPRPRRLFRKGRH